MEAPPWQRVPYILSGYRLGVPDLSGCIASVSHLHNQTGNILTHFLGLLYFVARLWFWARNQREHVGLIEYWCVLLVAAAPVYLMTLSVVYHVVHCHPSQEVHDCVLRGDRSGILAVVSSSFLGAATFCFAGAQQAFYLAHTAVITVLMALPCIIPERSWPAWAPSETWIFICCVLTGLPVGAHAMMVYPHLALFLRFFAGMAGCYSVGVVVYVQRFPECRAPGRYDLWGNSHQIWHCFIFFGCLSWTLCMEALFEQHLADLSRPPPSGGALTG